MTTKNILKCNTIYNHNLYVFSHYKYTFFREKDP